METLEIFKNINNKGGYARVFPMSLGKDVTSPHTELT